MYTDDLVIVSLSRVSLSICSDYGVKFDVKYNAKMSVVMICRTKEDQKLRFSAFYLAGQNLICNSCKYLGNIMNDKMEDV